MFIVLPVCDLLFTSLPALLRLQLALNCSSVGPGAAPAAGNVCSLLMGGSCANEHRRPIIPGILILPPPHVALFTTNRLALITGSGKRPPPHRSTVKVAGACCRGGGSRAVCADECRSGHTLCGPVPMGTAAIANSLFLCFLAMLPLLEG